MQNSVASNQFSPPSKSKEWGKQLTPLTSTTDPSRELSRQRPNSTWQLERDEQYRLYLMFKRKLLSAMTKLDPLALLQSGIFEEYESTLQPSAMKEQSKKHKAASVSPFQLQEIGYQNKLNRYEMSEGVVVTQLERRSQSCEKVSREERTIRRLQEERNIEFIIFASAMRSTGRQPACDQEQCEVGGMASGVQDQVGTEQKSWRSELRVLREELAIQREENNKLSLQLSLNSAMLQYQKTISETVTRDHNDRQLEFLLKEKQLTRKLLQAKQEIDTLRETIESSEHSRLASGKSPGEEAGKTGSKEGGLIGMRDKVEAEGRVRRALGRAWGAELWVEE